MVKLWKANLYIQAVYAGEGGESRSQSFLNARPLYKQESY